MRVLGICSLAIACVAVATASAGPSASPRLALVSQAPLTIRGTGFEPRERVLVVALVDGRRERRVRAGAAGGFVARFAVTAERCPPLVVRARGDRGSRAALRLFPLCPPPVAP